MKPVLESKLRNREEMYRGGGLFSVTSKILVNDFLSMMASPRQEITLTIAEGTVPAKLITGLVILHAEK
jgi:DNA excision repair protein ERCC-4